MPIIVSLEVIPNVALGSPSTCAMVAGVRVYQYSTADWRFGMYTSQLAKDIMVTKLVTLSPEVDVFKAIDLLLKHRISGAPVIDARRNFLGMFSEKNCMSVLLESAYEQHPTTHLYAFMDVEVPTINEDADLLDIARIFRDTHCRRLPVIRKSKLVGQISRRDLLKAAHNMMASAPDRESTWLYLSSIAERHEAPIV